MNDANGKEDIEAKVFIVGTLEPGMAGGQITCYTFYKIRFISMVKR